MKFTIKAQKVIREDFTSEISAKSYVDAVKLFKKKFNDCEIESINGSVIRNEAEASWQDSGSFEKELAQELNPLLLEEVKKILIKNRAIKKFVVEFSGSGDDGNVDHVSTIPFELEDVTKDIIGDFSIDYIVSRFAEPIANCVPLNWVDGEGGRGTIYISLDGSHIDIDVECFEYESTEGCSFSKKIKL